MSRIGDWLDARLGHRAVLHALRSRMLPNGPSWWLTSASCLFWLLVLQCVTGFLLMASYSPSMTSAWASIHFIDQTTAGRFVRGLHHFASHAMILLLVVHVARVLVSAAYRAPRELIWITGLLLIPLIVVWTVTGNPLSGSQKGMAQIEVEGHILGSTPLVGPILQRLLIGGDEVGNLTLTHLYFLHIGLLPLLVGLLCVVHFHQIFRHGVLTQSASQPSSPKAVPYWPHQSVRNQVVLAFVIGTVALLAATYGAPLEAPADPNLPHSPRPEWYFRWVFELRRHFTGDWEFIATMVVPTAILAFFLVVPLLDHWMSRRTGLVFRVALMLAGMGGWSYLTWTSFSRDWNDAEFLAIQRQFDELSDRARVLADVRQVSTQGAVELLQHDARTQGPLLFAKHCVSCHSHVDAEGSGLRAAEPSAPNLYGFGTTDWILGVLDPDRVTSSQVFGHTKFRDGDMVGKTRELFDSAGPEGAEGLRSNLRLVARALSSEVGLARQQELDRADAADIAKGRELLTGEFACTDCHRFGEQGELGSGPDLTGYGSHEWLAGMIGNPQGERFYPGERNDRMPSFAPAADHPEMNLLSPTELELLVNWLRGEWYEAPISGQR